MKKLTIFAMTMTLLTTGFAGHTIAQSTEPSSSGEALKVLLNPIATLQASFQQTVKSEKGAVLQKLSGKVLIKKPAQFRWQILGKESRLVVADGKKVWDFDKELDQVTVQKLETGQGRAPIYFLTGDATSIDKDFQIKALTGKDKCMQESNACFELKPKRTDGSFQWIRIGFKNKVLKEMEMLDQLGQYSQFIFKGVVLNENIAAKQFEFTPPPGVDVLKSD
jgi:outer membrane lipoprotein carrier protein